MSQKKSIFENPLLSTKVKSANAKIFPEGVLGYFLGPTLALLANAIISGYFNKYMTDVLNITSWASGFFTWLPVISVIFVVLGNILVGKLMDRNRTKAGKARPLLLVSLPLSILALLTLFVFSPYADATTESTQAAALVCIAIGYNLWFAIAYPFYYTSHAALVNLSTRNSKDRSLLATISNATALASMGLCTMILPFLFQFGLLFVEDANGVIDRTASYNQWKIFVIALMIVTVIGVLIEYYFTRERVTEESFKPGVQLQQKKVISTSKQASVCLKDKFWWIMIVFFFLYQFGGMVKNVSQLYYCCAMFPDASGVYSSGTGGSISGTIAIVGAIPTALGMVIAWPLSNKIGKGKAIMCGAFLSAIGGFIGFIDTSNVVLAYVAFAVKAFGSTPAMYLSLALLADVLDHQEAVHGFRTDGFTMTIYGAIMAGMTGVATGVLNGVLTACNYDATVSVSNEALRAVMPWVFLGVEAICYLIIALIFIFMGVEKFSALDKKGIESNQRAEAEAEGVEFVPAAEKLAQEEAEAEAASEEARKAELKAKCEKNGTSFEEAEAAYQKDKAQKDAVAAEKKKAADAAKAAKEAEKQKAAQAKLDAMTPEQRKALEDKQAQKAKAKAAKDAQTLKEFNEIRAKNGFSAIEA
jgi:GPH family glycoside/pentoside/hexuronide:cation symporter